MNTTKTVKELASVLTKIGSPVQGEKKPMKIPYWLAYILTRIIWNAQSSKKYLFPLPKRFKRLANFFTSYDPDLSRAFLDGRIYNGLNHEQTLKRVECPILLLHADWFRDPKYGLIGAMDDNDAKIAQQLAPHMIYKRIKSKHVIHSDKPKRFTVRSTILLRH